MNSIFLTEQHYRTEEEKAIYKRNQERLRKFQIYEIDRK